MTDRKTLRAIMDRLQTKDLDRANELRNRLALIRQVADHGLRRSPRSKLATQMKFIKEMAEGGCE